MFNRIGVIIAACVAIAAPWARAQTGSIEGVVVRESGAPLAGALVLYNNVPELTRDSAGRVTRTGPAVNWGAVTDASGRFTARNLPFGQYYVCAHGLEPKHLASCE